MKNTAPSRAMLRLRLLLPARFPRDVEAAECNASSCRRLSRQGVSVQGSLPDRPVEGAKTSGVVGGDAVLPILQIQPAGLTPEL